jgi:F0F1-type ATP synthase assembly protein I
MIKNLLNADEDPPPGTKVIIEETIVNPPAEAPDSESLRAEESDPNPENDQTFESAEDEKILTKPSPAVGQEAPLEEKDSLFITNAFAEPLSDEPEDFAALEAEIENLEAENLLLTETKNETAPVVDPAETEAVPVSAQAGAEKADNFPSGTLFQSEVKPPSTAETIRQSGLAYSAAIVLFGSVVFTMILGWFADLLLSSSPWGIVGGIILGGIIGFIQFFRITSQIFKK